MNKSVNKYIKTIYLFNKDNKQIKAIDLANHMQVTKANISKVLKKLKEEDLVIVDNSNYIALTKKGNIIASSLCDKCGCIKTYLMNTLKLSQEEACQNARAIEPYLTDECIDKIIKHQSNN